MLNTPEETEWNRAQVDRELEKLSETYHKQCATLNERRRVADYANSFVRRHAAAQVFDIKSNIAIGYSTIDCVYIDVRLQPEQSIKDIRPLLHEIAATRAFGPAVKHEYLEMEWLGWDFMEKPKEGITPQKLMFRVWYGSSKVCRQVGTGEFKEVMKVVCD